MRGQWFAARRVVRASQGNECGQAIVMLFLAGLFLFGGAALLAAALLA